jgi:hypothetical protein
MGSVAFSGISALWGPTYGDPLVTQFVTYYLWGIYAATIFLPILMVAGCLFAGSRLFVETRVRRRRWARPTVLAPAVD